MGRSRMPLLSLLCFFGALLLLFPELLMGMPRGLSHISHTNPGVQKALAFAVEQYNEDRDDSANYFKQFHLLKAKSQVDNGVVREYHLTVELVKTTCKKEAGKIWKYKKIQECKLLPGSLQKSTCYFKVTPRSPPYEMNLAISTCI